jgi:hypothetical protein
MLNGEQVALKLTEALQVQVNSAILTPDDLEGGIASGAIKTAAYIEPTYAAGILEWVRQTYEGKLNFKGATTTVEELTGTAALSLVDWATRNREAILEAGTAFPGLNQACRPDLWKRKLPEMKQRTSFAQLLKSAPSGFPHEFNPNARTTVCAEPG